MFIAQYFWMNKIYNDNIIPKIVKILVIYFENQIELFHYHKYDLSYISFIALVLATPTA